MGFWLFLLPHSRAIERYWHCHEALPRLHVKCLITPLERVMAHNMVTTYQWAVKIQHAIKIKHPINGKDEKAMIFFVLCNKATALLRRFMWSVYDMSVRGICIYVCKSQRISGILFCHSTPYSFETGSLTEFGDKLVENKTEWFSFLCPTSALTVLEFLTTV